MGRNSLRKERKQNPKKKQEIINGLINYFKENSLADSNMDEIAQGLNKSKATLYKYYKSKEQMINALVDFKINEVSKFVPILRNKNIAYLKRYEMSFSLLEDHISDVSNDFMSDLRQVFPNIFHKVDTLIDLAANELSVYYELGMEKGIFNQLNAKLLAQNDFVFFRILIDPDFLKENKLTMQQAFKDFYDIRCKGLIVK